MARSSTCKPLLLPLLAARALQLLLLAGPTVGAGAAAAAPTDDATYDTSDTVVIEAAASGDELEAQSRRGRQFWPGLLPLGPCFSSKGELGRCTSFRQCYPYFKLPELTNWETWVLGMYDTCTYFTASGRQLFGVCCTNPATPRPPQYPTQPPPVMPPEHQPGHPGQPVYPGEPGYPGQPEQPGQPGHPGGQPINPNPIPPNWPPPIPTHSPNNTIPPLPTHPPSPGWPGLEPTTETLPEPPTQSTSPPTRPPTAMPWPPTAPTHPPSTTTRPPWNPQPWPPTPPQQPPTTTTSQPPDQPSDILSDGSCGARNSAMEQERIVLGHNADKGEWPWMAALFNGGRQFCGGSLIDNIHILTAAHCVAHMSSWDVARLTVRLGDYDIKTNYEVRHIEKKVKRVVRHRGFDSRTLYNDVAVLTLDSPVAFTREIRPVCLPSGTDMYAGKTATVIGWGSLRESGPQPAILQEVNIRVWSNQECRLKYGNAAPGGIVEHFLCAGNDGKDSCSGDSGGPLMINNGRWTQVGVVSWGIGCGKGQYPGVYTRVTHFMSWITKNLK